MVFWTIPYGPDPKIGAIDHDFQTENPVLREMCHPRVAKSAIFRDFLAKSVKTARFMAQRAYIWPELPKMTLFSHFELNWLFWPVWPCSASNWLVFDHFC